MHFSAIAAAAVAFTPLLASARGQLGFALGVRHPDGTCKNKDDFGAEFKQLSPYAKVVRTYAAIDGGLEGGDKCTVPTAILPAAQAAGIKVILGIWPDTNSSYDTDVAAILSSDTLQYKDSILAVTVGSETLYRHQHDPATGLTAEVLKDRIDRFKANATSKGLNVDVGTAESWNKFQDGTADSVIPSLDIALVNAFGYWQSQDISNASATYRDDLAQAYSQIQKISGSTTKPKLWNGETGWPTDGGDNYFDPAIGTTAVASTQNAQKFFDTGVCGALNWDYNVFYFEAYAEPWKKGSVGTNGKAYDEKHWGAFDSTGTKLLDLSCGVKSEL